MWVVQATPVPWKSILDGVKLNKIVILMYLILQVGRRVGPAARCRQQGAKKVSFYILPFGQAVDSMY